MLGRCGPTSMIQAHPWTGSRKTWRFAANGFPNRRRTWPSCREFLPGKGFSRLPKIAAPTLVVHGETDQLVPAGNGELIASRIAGARLVLLPRASHIFTTDQPEASQK